MRLKQTILPAVLGGLLPCFLLGAAHGQTSASSPSSSLHPAQALPAGQAARIDGYALDNQGAAIPGAIVNADGPSPDDHRSVKADETGYFNLTGLRPALAYHLTVTANGFHDYLSPPLTLSPGEQRTDADVKLEVGDSGTTINVVPSDVLALEQVKAEEQQRILGVLPNFFVVYDSNPAPLTAKLKFRLSLKASTDVVSFAGAAFLAGIDQAADTPDYVQGAKGFGQRMGAAYAGGTSDILFGGAVYPSLLRQDPRYYYQGTGTKKSRALHAVASPFICRGDNGRREFNYSSVAGDLTSGGLANLYYPNKERGVGLVFDTALILTGGRMVNALAQEFVFHRLTTKASTAK